MAIPYDLTKIETKLSTFSTKAEKIHHLNKLLSARKKALAEFEMYDLQDLERLKKKTKEDFKKYKDAADDNGLPPYLHPLNNEGTAKRLGLQNIKLLEKRVRLQDEYNDLIAQIRIFEAMAIEVGSEVETINTMTKTTNSSVDYVKEKMREIQTKEKVRQAERAEQKIRFYKALVEPYPEYYTSFDRFERHSRVIKGTLSSSEYLAKLGEYERMYSDLKVYHTMYGEGLAPMQIFEKILTLVISEIDKAAPKQKEDISAKAIADNESNTFCPSMKLVVAQNHFKVLTEKVSKNGKKFLTDIQLNSFINRAFCGNNDIPKQKFNQAPKGEKLLIQAVFYEFYNRYCFEYFNTMQCQDNFVKLLTENFEGWNFKNVKDNFKPKTNKRL